MVERHLARYEQSGIQKVNFLLLLNNSTLEDLSSSIANDNDN